MAPTRREFLTLAAGGLGLAGLAAGAGALATSRGSRNTMGEGKRIRTAFIPHGGGPWPVLELPTMDPAEGKSLADYMRSIAAGPRQPPSFLVVISAHWEATNVTVHAGSQPGMYYDYGGFPREAYQLEWQPPGAPERAANATELLRKAGFRVDEERERGFDHGTFIPLMLAYPEATIPVVQVSLRRSLDPAEHLAMGRALAPLRDDGAYIVGSGNSYHNLRKFFHADDRARQEAAAFDSWLNEAVASSPEDRAKMLADWERAPAARACHPREEHLIPLMVAAGAAENDVGGVQWQGTMNGLPLSAHYFG